MKICGSFYGCFEGFANEITIHLGTLANLNGSLDHSFCTDTDNWKYYSVPPHKVKIFNPFLNYFLSYFRAK